MERRISRRVWKPIEPVVEAFWLWRFHHPSGLLWLQVRLIMKEVMDWTLAGMALVALLPVMAAIAAVIRMESPGPVIYSQERVGRFGRPFRIYKFRSMVVNAEQSGPVWSKGGRDPRITRVGWWLRRWHLDELPQLWNVLKGDMSIVGPRPERPAIVASFEDAVPGYGGRHLIKPGLTGLAQVHYRYDASVSDVRRKLRFDLLYVKRMCLALDVKIMALTIGTVLAGNGK